MAFITGKPVRALIAATRCGRLAAVQLEEIGADPLEDAIDQCIVRIDHDGDRADPAAGDGGKDAGLFQFDMARALGKEDEPDKVGAGVRRCPRRWQASARRRF